MKNNHIPYITNTLYNNSKKKNKTLNNLNSITLYQNNSSNDKNDKKNYLTQYIQVLIKLLLVQYLIKLKIF